MLDVRSWAAGPAGLAVAIAAQRGGPRLRRGGEGRARELHLPLPAQHGLLHDRRPARDRRPALRHALREAHAGRGAEVLPARGRDLPICAGHGRGGHGHRPRAAGAPSFAVHSRCAQRTTSRSRRARHVVLATGYYDHPNLAGRPRRGPAPRLPLLPTSRTRSTGGRWWSWAARTPPPSSPSSCTAPGPRSPSSTAAPQLARLRQVLDPARHREPHQGRRVAARVRDPRGRDPPGCGRRGGPARPERDRGRGRLPADGLPPRRARCCAGAGVRVDAATLVPEHDPRPCETNVPGLYVAGAFVSGRETSRIFIENGRFHGAGHRARDRGAGAGAGHPLSVGRDGPLRSRR